MRVCNIIFGRLRIIKELRLPQKSSENLEEVLFSAEEDLKLAQQRYELGSASILELLDAQLALIQASSSLVRTKYDAAIQVASLDDLLGTLDKKYE